MSRLVATLAMVLCMVSAREAQGGVHVGNIFLGLYDDDSPAVTMHPDETPKLALLTCGQSIPTIINAEYDANGKPYFPLDSDIGNVCAVGLDLGSPVDIRVSGTYVATAEPAPIGFAISSTPVGDLVGATIRAGTSTMMSEIRAIAAVPRTATSSEESMIASALSVLTLDLP